MHFWLIPCSEASVRGKKSLVSGAWSGSYLLECQTNGSVSYRRLPPEMGLLPNLKSVVLDGNPMKGIRRDIIMVSFVKLPIYFCFVNLLSITALVVIFFQLSWLLSFCLPFSSASIFLGLLFWQSSHHSCGLPCLRQPPCFFVSAIFCNLSSFILTMRPANLTRLFCTTLPTRQDTFQIYHIRSFILLLSTRFTPAILLLLEWNLCDCVVSDTLLLYMQSNYQY